MIDGLRTRIALSAVLAASVVYPRYSGFAEELNSSDEIYRVPPVEEWDLAEVIPSAPEQTSPNVSDRIVPSPAQPRRLASPNAVPTIQETPASASSSKLPSLNPPLDQSRHIKPRDSVMVQSPVVESGGAELSRSGRPAESGTSAAIANSVVAPAMPRKIPRVHPSVIRRVNQLFDEAVSLANRGAVFSARAQLLKSLRLIAQSLDAESQTQYFSQSLADGMQALNEAADFAPSGAGLEMQLRVENIVDAHRTAILKNRQPAPTPLAALQMYHAYAEEKIAAACGHETAASRVLVALAKLQPMLASQDSDATSLAVPRSMSLYQAALIVNPDHYLAANELGVLFAKYGQLEDARDLLAHCAEIDPANPVAWKNLASVHQHLGETELAAAAQHEWLLASGSGPGKVSVPTDRPQVQWVAPEAFAVGGRPKTEASHSTRSAETQKHVPRPSERIRSADAGSVNSAETTRFTSGPEFPERSRRGSDSAGKNRSTRTAKPKGPEKPSSRIVPKSWSERFSWRPKNPWANVK